MNFDLKSPALRPFITAVAGAACGLVFSWLASRGFDLDASTQTHVTALAEAAITGAGLVGYGIGKTFLSRYIHPSNAARPSKVPTTDPDAPGPTIAPGAVLTAEAEAELSGEKRTAKRLRKKTPTERPPLPAGPLLVPPKKKRTPTAKKAATTPAPRVALFHTDAAPVTPVAPFEADPNDADGGLG